MSDRGVVAAVQAGDREAFRLLVERHSRNVFKLGFRMMGNEQDAEEVVQETFLKAYRAIGGFESRANFATWLYRIASNCSLDLLQKRKPQRAQTPLEDEEGEEVPLPSPNPGPERLLLSGELKQKLAAAMERLSAVERTAFVLRHFEGESIEEIGKKIRSYSTDCALDLGGQTLYWLGDPKPAESIAWLSGFASHYAQDDDTPAEGALNAIAFHRDPAADGALQVFIAPTQNRKLRQQAAFWLGNSRGQRGFEIVRDAIRNDQDTKFREEATFALSQSEVPAAQQELIRLAHQDADSEVRGQALFWLAQKAGQKAGKAITDAIDNDPDTAVKKKAVFALSQMDHNEGVPLLINVAKTHKNPAVRKEAIFWLGQSNDPRALDYIESILTR